jgi:DNA ligase 1
MQRLDQDGASNYTGDALANHLEKANVAVRQAYGECPSYDDLIPALLEYGVRDLADHVHFQPGIPIKAMLARPTNGVTEVLDKFSGSEFTCEFKYDGERAQVRRQCVASWQGRQQGKLACLACCSYVQLPSLACMMQVHVLDDGSVHIYSRNLENTTSKYPDIVARMPKAMAPGVRSVVVDGEVQAWDTEKQVFLPFQVLTTRKRKDVTEDQIKVQVRCSLCYLLEALPFSEFFCTIV